MNYLFTLGRTIPLCLAELEALLKFNEITYKIILQIENHVIVDITREVDTEQLLKQSGGMVKISSLRGTIASTPPHDWDLLASFVHYNSNFKNFGVSLVGFQENIVRICEEMKKDLKMHYILPKDGNELSSAQILNKNILELVIVKIGDEYQVFQTLSVQDINYWTRKDTGRPFVDDKLGMLPLKVARMMINLGRGSREAEKEAKNTLMDPFCGMGSILVEAIDLGFIDVIGGDIQEDVLQKCRANIEWFKKEFKYLNANTEFFLSDATKISEKLHRKIDLIVTEPFMGDAKIIQNLKTRLAAKWVKNQSLSPSAIGDDSLKLKNIVKGLSKMYLGCLKNWRIILNSNSVVVIIVPEITVENRLFTLPFVEICAKTGYNILAQYEYSREKAIVKRKIFLLKIIK